MKTICVCFLAVVAVAFARPNEQYTDKYDNVDLDEVLDNRRLLEKYFMCLMGEGKCPPDGKELKDHIIEALENKCAKCSDKHKEGVRKVISHLINKESEYWKQLVAKYDPDNKFSKKYEDELRTIKA